MRRLRGRVAVLAAIPPLLLAGCLARSGPDRGDLEDHRAWLLSQPGVQSVDAALVDVPCDSCWGAEPRTGSVTAHLRAGTTPARLTALGDALRAHHARIVNDGTAITVVVDGLRTTLGASPLPGVPDPVAVERDDVALLDAVRRTRVAGATGTVDDGIVTLQVPDGAVRAASKALTAAGSPLTTAAAGTRAANVSPTGRPDVPPGVAYLDVRGSGQEGMALLVGGGALPQRSRAMVGAVEALGNRFPHARAETDTREDTIRLARGEGEWSPGAESVTPAQWAEALTTISAHAPQVTVAASVSRRGRPPLPVTVSLATVPVARAAQIPALAEKVPAGVVLESVLQQGGAVSAALHTTGRTVPTPEEEKAILAAARSWPLSAVVSRYEVRPDPRQVDPAHPPGPTPPPTPPG